MTIDQVVKHFGGLYGACKLLKISTQNGQKWRRQGYIPYKQQLRLYILTEGKLIPDTQDPALLNKKNKE